MPPISITTPGALDERLADAEIIAALSKRLGVLRTSATEALAQCLGLAGTALSDGTTPSQTAGYVDPATLVAFCGALLYGLSDEVAQSAPVQEM